MVLNLETTGPSPQLKERILAATAESPKIVPLRPPREERGLSMAWLPWALAACRAVLAGGRFVRNAALHKRLSDLAALNSSSQLQIAELTEIKGKSEQQIAELNALNSKSEQRITELTAAQGKSEQQIAMLQTALDDLRGRHRVAEIQVAVLDSLLHSSPKAMAVSVWDKDAKEGSLVVKNLAPLPSDKTYQAWVMDPITKKPVSAGTFGVDQQGGVRFFFRPVDGVGTVATVAVSEEAAGGSTTEKGPTRVVLMGNLE
jgi:anti-sigma-K factor RskA